MKRRLVIAALFLAVVIFSIPIAALAGSNDITMHGTVAGPGGAIGAASVKVEYLARGGLPRRTALLTTDAGGGWLYSGKAGDYRVTVSADGYYDRAEVLHTLARTDYVLNTVLAPEPPPTATILGRIYGATGNGLPGYVYFFRQNDDGTWPTGYLWQVGTAADGTYTSGPLALGTYKVRLFTVHTGVQWWRYAATIETATPIVLDTDGQVVTGIDARFPPPAP